MRVGITYLYTIYRYGYPHSAEDALKSLGEIRKLGFRYLEMEGLGPAHMRAVSRARQRFRETLDGHGMHVHNFCVVDPALVSLNAAARGRALELFKLGAEVADFLDAETLHLASYAPPVRYLTAKPYQLAKGGKYSFAGRTTVRIPPGFDWERVWEALVISCQACADIAAPRTVLMEPRVGETVGSVDSLLRLIGDVGRPNFKANFDTGHFSAQRENVPLALMKLRGRFANIHISDNDPVNAEHLPIGEGSIDWREFFRVLQMLKYDGYLGLDLGAGRGLVRGYRTSVERLEELAGELKFKLEV